MILEKEVLLEAEHIKMYFNQGGGFLNKKTIKAVNDVSFVIHKGETLGLVGESGCGKSTLGKCIVRLLKQTSGSVKFRGEEITEKNEDKFASDLQMIFQDPLSALNPRMTIFDIIAEPMIVQKICKSEEIEKRVYALMDYVGLRREMSVRYPHEFSGGQCQRIGIARAMALNPAFIVCDEPVSALDVSIKAQIINMFADIQKKTDVSYLFITHDLLTARYISHRTAVMYLGQIVEIGPTNEVYDNPYHPYTKALLSAISPPDLDELKERKRIPLKGEIPSPLNTPSGCPFRTRCSYASEKCAEKAPPLKELKDGHFAACYLY